MAMFGKTLGNGYAITAVVGKQEIMDAAQSTFISSTFWTERIGPAAALKTLEIMEKTRSWELISDIGIKVSNKWEALANKYDLNLDIRGIKALPTFTFMHDDHLKFKTYLTQEMLKRGFLANTSFYACIEHSDDILESYFENLEPIFFEIKKCMDGKDIDKLLEGPISHSGFERLN